MKVTYNGKPSEAAQRTLECLQTAVTNALEKKRCLGQYAVIWKDGKSVALGGNDAPKGLEVVQHD